MLWTYLMSFVGVGLAMSALWLVAIRHFANCLIWFTCLFSAGLSFALAFYCFSLPKAQVTGVIFLFLGLLKLLWLYLIRARIEFATAMLQIVTHFLSDFPSAIYLSFSFLFVQAGWSLAWAVAAGYALNSMDRKSGSYNFAVFALLVSFYWGAQTIRNVVHTTAAGSFATWYFYPPSTMPENPTMDSFKRATTTSFGSICFGSLLIAIVNAIRAMLNHARKSDNGFAVACATCLIRCLEDIINYFNTYAFTYVAIYGTSYCDSAKSVFNLFATKGIDMIINDDLTGMVMTFGSLIGGLVTGAFGYYMSAILYPSPSSSTSSDYILWTVVAFLIGFVLCMCAMEVVHSCIASFFVCFAEDPAALYSAKPQVYQKISEAWRARYPESQHLVM